MSRVVPALVKRASSPGEDADTTRASSLAATGLDIEQRARAAHGWRADIANSLARGSIIYYDTSGRATGQYAVTILRGYPDRVRVEIDRGSTRETFGFNQTSAWKGGVANPTAAQERDIRALVRFCPERLFVSRAGGAAYREAGQRIDDIRPMDGSSDWTSAPSSGASETQADQTIFDQVEVTDSLGPAASRSAAGDVRRLYYYVDTKSSLVSAARWLEPDDPRKSIDDEAASFTDVRVDFGDWRESGGVKWPFRIVHSTGGRVDFKLVLNEVKVNESLAEAVFQRP